MRKKWSFKTGDLLKDKRGSVHMKLSMTGQENSDLFFTGDCLIKMTA
jgi:hypothetical protein